MKGPGTELKTLFNRFGFHPSFGCACNFIANQMDEIGPWECWLDRGLIAEAIHEEAKTRGWDFFGLQFILKLLILTSILLSYAKSKT